MAGFEVAFPRLLVATHLYSPLSVLFTFDIVNVLLSPPRLILESPLALTLVHDIVGTGSPLALQDKVTLLLSTAVVSCGCVVI